MNPVAMTIINPRKEYSPRQEWNQRPHVLKSAMLPTGQNFRVVKTGSICRRQIKVIEEKLGFFCDRLENIVGKGENAGNQHFSFSHNVFKRLLIVSLKAGIL